MVGLTSLLGKKKTPLHRILKKTMESLFLMNYNRCEENISVFKKISVLLKKIQ